MGGKEVRYPPTRYSMSEYFTLIPIEIAAEARNRDEMYRKVMTDLYPELKESQRIYALPVRKYKAVLLFTKSDKAPRNYEPDEYKYLKLLPTILAHNKVIIDFNPKAQSTLVLLAEGSRLICVNRYKTADFGSALYFLVEALQKSDIAPRQTIVNAFGPLLKEDCELAEKYVRRLKRRS